MGLSFEAGSGPIGDSPAELVKYFPYSYCCSSCARREGRLLVTYLRHSVPH